MSDSRGGKAQQRKIEQQQDMWFEPLATTRGRRKRSSLIFFVRFSRQHSSITSNKSCYRSTPHRSSPHKLRCFHPGQPSFEDPHQTHFPIPSPTPASSPNANSPWYLPEAKAPPQPYPTSSLIHPHLPPQEKKQKKRPTHTHTHITASSPRRTPTHAPASQHRCCCSYSDT